MTKNHIHTIDFLCQIEILLLNMLKQLKYQVYLVFFFKFHVFPGFFSQIPGFSNFFRLSCQIQVFPGYFGNPEQSKHCSI